MPADRPTVPAWSVKLRNGGQVTLARIADADRNVFTFHNGEHETNIVLSDAALSAVVALAVTRAGVPVLVDCAPHATNEHAERDDA